MSSSFHTTSTFSNFETLFNAALAKYNKQTGKDLRHHPLAFMIDNCHSSDSILEIFQKQSEAFDEFRRGDTKLFKWLRPVVNVLHALSTNSALSVGASLVSPAMCPITPSVYSNSLSPRCFLPQRRFSPVSRSFYPCVSISFLHPTPCHIRDCQEAKYVRASYDALVDIFQCIENFIGRLKIYTEIPPTPAMTEMVIKIIIELLYVLALATKQINQGRFSMSVLVYNFPWLTCVREIRKEILRRKGHRIGVTEAR
jgi:hypothetical protein